MYSIHRFNVYYTLIVFLGLIPLSAQESSDLKHRVEAAESLLITMELEKRMDSGFEGMVPLIKQIARNLNLNPLELKQLHNIYKAWYTEDFDHKRLFDKTAQMYAEQFTLKELNDLNKFYKTPLGQKLQSKMPILYEQSSNLGIQEGRAKQPLLDKRLDPFMDRILAKRRPSSATPLNR